ncbi:hypothetical protein G3576_19990 [Roseomonas stagni]|uniref:Uncharacterized protein n=1 Tax=Falsiroseomonas algicola TaxID=2716930 RepID=A0A6M1LPL6_9PROT|nr:hypothetical protein [Falsiroseomonas algicola]NGM22310.1 hypothetical protein [Falsiroseomonas algicola]
MLQEIQAALTIPGLPDWVGLVFLVCLLLVGLAYLLMPFSVFGVKGRLDAIEAQLDEIQTELRSLSLRTPEPGRRRPALEEDWVDPSPALRPAAEAAPRVAPPVPPPPAWPDRSGGPSRSEPRLDWPRTPR